MVKCLLSCQAAAKRKRVSCDKKADVGTTMLGISCNNKDRDGINR